MTPLCACGCGREARVVRGRQSPYATPECGAKVRNAKAVASRKAMRAGRVYHLPNDNWNPTGTLCGLGKAPGIYVSRADCNCDECKAASKRRHEAAAWNPKLKRTIAEVQARRAHWQTRIMTAEAIP